MVSRNRFEFVVGLIAAGVVSGGLSLHLATPYALVVGLAVATPALVRTSANLDRERYDAAKSTNAQVVDGATVAAATVLVGLAGGYLAVSNGYSGPVAAAVAAAAGVFTGQAVFYVRNNQYME